MVGASPIEWYVERVCVSLASVWALCALTNKFYSSLQMFSSFPFCLCHRSVSSFGQDKMFVRRFCTFRILFFRLLQNFFRRHTFAHSIDNKRINKCREVKNHFAPCAGPIFLVCVSLWTCRRHRCHYSLAVSIQLFQDLSDSMHFSKQLNCQYKSFGHSSQRIGHFICIFTVQTLNCCVNCVHGTAQTARVCI